MASAWLSGMNSNYESSLTFPRRKSIQEGSNNNIGTSIGTSVGSSVGTSFDVNNQTKTIPNNGNQLQQQQQSPQKSQQWQLVSPALVKVLYPPSKTFNSGSSQPFGATNSSKSNSNQATRFSQLLLDPGEKPVQDWSVVAFSLPDTTEPTTAGHSGRRQRSQRLREHHEQQNLPNSFGTSGRVRKAKGVTWFQSPNYSNSFVNKSSMNNNHTFNTEKTGNSSNDSIYHHQQYLKDQNKQRREGSLRASDDYVYVDSADPSDPSDPNYAATCHMKNIQGRLYLCTASLVFEPNDWCRGIVRCPFSKMEHGPPVSTTSNPSSFEIAYGSDSNNSNNSNNSYNSTGSYETILSVQFQCRRHFVMKEDNRVAPYRQVSIPTLFRFVFLHSSPTHFLELTSSMFQAATAALSRSSSNNYSIINNIDSSPLHSKSIHGNATNDGPGLINRRTSSSTPTTALSPWQAHTNSFDSSNIFDVREQILTPTTTILCSIITPLQSQSGIILVTSERLYFQKQLSPSHSCLPPVQKWNRSTIVAIARRYSGLRDTALEVYFQVSTSLTNSRKGGGSSSSVLFAFERRHDREVVLRCLQTSSNENVHNSYNSLTTNTNFKFGFGSPSQVPTTIPCLTHRDFVVQCAMAWRKGVITNYEYILALNCAAGRSFHDLSRYPVFPWVIRDYTSYKLDLTNEATFRDLSKPMGALNAERLEYFRSRYIGMTQDSERYDRLNNHYDSSNKVSNTNNTNNLNNNSTVSDDEAFLYGTHYSAPGYVLYFLVRTMPEHMLCLQNGKFDAPDRMFHSIAACFHCALTNHADVKELIPEFYNPSLDYDFLINARGLQLGATQSGDRVDDVKLPPWAKGSPREFIKLNIKALESDICSQKLPGWIDLIFGSKSRGQQALDANNLFHPYSYLGPNDLASMASEYDRTTAELQATEFGIVPDQLFIHDHPGKDIYASDSSTFSSSSPNDISCDWFISPDIGRSPVLPFKQDDPLKETWELLDSSGAMISTSVGQMEYFDSPNAHTHNGNLNLNSNFNNYDRVTSVSANQDKYRVHITVRPTDSDMCEDLEITQASSLGSSNDAFEHWNTHTSPNTTIAIAAANSTTTITSNNNNNTDKNNSTNSTKNKSWNMKVIERKQIHNDAVSGCILIFDDNYNYHSVNSDGDGSSSMLATTSLDGALKVHSLSLHSSALSPKNHSSNNEEDKGISGAISSTLNRFSSSYSTILNRGPSVGILASSTNNVTFSSKLTEYRTHSARDPVACLVVTSDGSGGSVAFVGGHDDVILAFGIKSGAAVASVYSHRDAVTGLDLIQRTPFDANSALWLENSTHVLVSGSWDSTVKVWSASVAAGEAVSINREPLAEFFDTESSVVCVSACRSSVYRESDNSKGELDLGIVVAASCNSGSLYAWMLYSDGVQVLIHKEVPRKGSGQCSVLKWVTSSTNLHLFAGYTTGKVASYKLDDKKSSLKRENAVSIGTGVLSLSYCRGAVLVGCADGGIRLLTLSHNSMAFDPTIRPVLWPAVHGSVASPGVSSLCWTLTRATQDSDRGGSKSQTSSKSMNNIENIICCSGAEDGSIVLFELKEE